MSFLKKNISYRLSFFSIFFLVLSLGAFFSVSHTYAADIGDACTAPAPATTTPLISGTCKPLTGAVVCNPATMWPVLVATSMCPTASFCCIPQTSVPAPTSCIYLGGAQGAQCVIGTDCNSGAIISAATNCPTYPGNPTADEVCCKTGGLVAPGAPLCTSVSGQQCLSNCGGATPNPKSGFSCPTGVCCGPIAPGGPTSCPTGGCTGGQCTTLGGSCSGTSCTNGSFGSCSLGGECCKPAGVPGASASIPFPNPLKFTTVEGVLGGLLGALQGIIVVLSLVFIVIGAVLYITSAGDDGRMKTAKGAITASMIGLAIGIAAPSFLKQIGTILDWNTPAIVCPSTLSTADLASCQAALATYNSGKTLTEIALSVLQFLLSIVGILGIIMLVIGGIMYLTAAGDEHRIDSGKGIVKYAIIGIAVALAALVIVTQIAGLIA